MVKNLEITLSTNREIRITRSFEPRANWCGTRTPSRLLRLDEVLASLG